MFVKNIISTTFNTVLFVTIKLSHFNKIFIWICIITFKTFARRTTMISIYIGIIITIFIRVYKSIWANRSAGLDFISFVWGKWSIIGRISFPTFFAHALFWAEFICIPFSNVPVTGFEVSTLVSYKQISIRLTFLLDVQNTIPTNCATWDIELWNYGRRSFFNIGIVQLVSFISPETRVHFVPHFALTWWWAMSISCLALFLLLVSSISAVVILICDSDTYFACQSS